GPRRQTPRSYAATTTPRRAPGAHEDGIRAWFARPGRAGESQRRTSDHGPWEAVGFGASRSTLPRHSARRTTPHVRAFRSAYPTVVRTPSPGACTPPGGHR